jgi:pSer/pThr/pTyr-binding forkhead associated (FHA) protein
MVTKLVVSSGKSAGRTISIKRNKLLIGRAEECDVRPLSEEVSRRHCAVHVGPAEVWVEDLGSRNGTFVNGTKITERTQVKDGDMIRVGGLQLKVSCTEPSAKAGTDEDVSRWLVTDERPSGMFETTQSVAASDAGNGAERPADADASPTPVGETTLVTTAQRSPAALEVATKPTGVAASGKKTADSSRDAAAEALKKFFDRR